MKVVNINGKSKLDILLDPSLKKEVAKNLLQSNNFFVIPANKPFLNSHITSFQWNSGKKEITLTIDETIKVEAYNWINQLTNYVNCFGEEASVSDEIIVLALFDDDHNETALIQFDSIKLKDHGCSLGCTVFGIAQDVTHTVTLTYNNSVFIDKNDFQCSDDEWFDQSLEMKLEEI